MSGKNQAQLIFFGWLLFWLLWFLDSDDDPGVSFLHELLRLLAPIRYHVVVGAAVEVAGGLPQQVVQWVQGSKPERQEGPVLQQRREMASDVGLEIERYIFFNFPNIHLGN